MGPNRAGPCVWDLPALSGDGCGTSAPTLSLASPCPRAAILEQSLNFRTRLCSKKRPDSAADRAPIQHHLRLHLSADIHQLPLTLAWRLPASWGPLPASLMQPKTPLWFHITPMLQQSLRVQLERALFPWDPLQFFESSLAARVYLSGPLSVSYFLFSGVCAHAEGRFLKSVLSPTMWVP